MRFVGVDLAWGPNGRTGLCAVEGGRVLASASVTPDEAILDWVRPHLRDACLVAVDAPLVVSNGHGRRPCERTITRWLGARHAGAHSSNLGLPGFAGGPRAMRLAEALDVGIDPAIEPGVPVRRLVEVYPHPALVVLFGLPRTLKYKRRRGRPPELRRAALARLLDLLESLRGADPPLDVVAGNARWPALRAATAPPAGHARLGLAEDEIDAYVCAYVALHHWTHGAARSRVVGDVAEGYIVIPVTATDGTPDADLAARMAADGS